MKCKLKFFLFNVELSRGTTDRRGLCIKKCYDLKQHTHSVKGSNHMKKLSLVKEVFLVVNTPAGFHVFRNVEYT